jgi:hypothetical protein
MEQRFGYDFSRVRIHADAAAARSAQDVHAHAYTVGQDVVFGAGRFTPDTYDGRRLLAHELTHVIQQSAAPEAALQRKPDNRSLTDAADPINEDDSPGYAWHEILSVDSRTKPNVNYVRAVVRENTEVDQELLDAAAITWVNRKNVSGTNRPSSYYAFRDRTKGTIARAFAELDERIDPGREPAADESFRYKFYVFSAHTSNDRPHYAALAPLSSAPPLKENEMDEATHWLGPEGRPNLGGKRCRFFIFDDQAPTFGNLWAIASGFETQFRSGAYHLPSGKNMETLLKTVLDAYSTHGCGCVSEIQFWSHGSPGEAMYITGDGEFTTESFEIPGVEVWGDGPIGGVIGYEDWTRHLSALQRLLVVLRRTICDRDSEVYFRSCQAFKGESGQKFADAAGKFWRSIVIGHTKLIGLSQPGQKRLKPGDKPDWSVTEGEDEEGKKGKTKPDFVHIKPR